MPSSPGPPSWRSPFALLFPCLAVVASVGYYLSASVLSPPFDSAAYGLWVLALVALAGGGLKCCRLRLSDLGLGDSGDVLRAAAVGAGAAALYFVVLAQPGFYLGFGWRPLPEGWSGVALFVTAPVLAVAGSVLFQGLLLRAITRRFSLGWGLALSSVAFGVAFGNLALLATYGVAAVGGYVLVSTLVSALFGLVLGVFYYKTNWNLVGPTVLRTGVLWGALFLPLTPVFPTFELEYAFELLAATVVLIVLAVALHEYRFLARRHLGQTFGARRDRFLARGQRAGGLRSGGVVLGITALAVVLVIVLSGVVLGTQPPTLAVASDSMSPALVRGDLVVLQHVSPGEITVGTIIAYSGTCLPSPTVHRVTAVQVTASGEFQYTTKGDANGAPDPCPVTYGEVQGRVVAVIPVLGFAVLFPELTAAAIVGLALAVIAFPRQPTRFPPRPRR